MDVTQLLGSLLRNSLQSNVNGQSQQRGQKCGKEPTGVISVTLGADERLEARYWENPILGTNEIRIGYTKPRISDRSKTGKPFHSYQLRHAFAEMEATYRVCEQALKNHIGQQINLTEPDRVVAQEVVKTFGGCFGSRAPAQPTIPADGSFDLSSLLINGR